ncbi:MAG TPA: zinc ABC transporter substrate-binding protein [Burkholderiales bacterium]|jgi:zinc/manganese transport system substrate-binding protein|nr:zinc ABC transporter substrate-binding protein [Burkholderiales bacterium]
MKRILNVLFHACVAAALAVTAGLARAEIDVLACEPVWGALVGEIAGDKARIYTATTALQDPHRAEARPSLLARARSAALLVCTGADLEVGWLPVVLRQAGNPRIQPGAPGHLLAADHVPLLEVPKVLDRSLGDVHPAGNPHIWYDPRNIALVATVFVERLAAIDPPNADAYRTRGEAFQTRWREAIVRWQREAAPLRGMKAISYHLDMTYLYAWLGIVNAGTLEPRPGIPPAAGDLAALLERTRKDPPRFIVITPFQDRRAADWLAERTRAPVVVVPFTVGGTGEAGDLYGLFGDTIARLLGVLK